MSSFFTIDAKTIKDGEKYAILGSESCKSYAYPNTLNDIMTNSVCLNTTEAIVSGFPALDIGALVDFEIRYDRCMSE